LQFQDLQHSEFDCFGIEGLRFSAGFAFFEPGADGFQLSVLFLLKMSRILAALVAIRIAIRFDLRF